MKQVEALVALITGYLASQPLLAAAAIVGLCSILALVVERVARVGLRRLLGGLPADLGKELERALRRPIRLSILILGVMAALAVAAPEGRIEQLGQATGQTLLVLLWAAFGIRALHLSFERQSVTGLAGAAQSASAPLLRNGLTIVIVLVTAYTVLVAWGVNVTGLLASAGILGLALAIAAQDTLGNLVAGIAILTDKPYRIGDYIVLDTGERGEVTHIGLRSTRLLTRDDVEVSIPNGIMGRAKIVNESGGPIHKYRLRMPVRVAYGEDIDRAMALMLSVAAGHPQVCGSPEPRMRLRQLGESGLEFEMLCWIEQPALRGLVAHELNCGIYRLFAAEGVSIPYPQRDVHVYDARQPVAASLPSPARDA
jgi:small-conductance mechanosensitive channel